MSADEERLRTDRRYGDGGHAELANAALFASYFGHPKRAIELLRLAFDRPGGYGVSAMEPGTAMRRW